MNTTSQARLDGVLAGVEPTASLPEVDSDVYTEVFHGSPVCKSKRLENT